MADMIKQPAHYTKGKIEVWDFILDQGMNYLEGNIVKYLCRYKHKGNPVQDLDKAIAYLTKLRDTEYAKQEPKLLPNGKFDKAGTIPIKPTPPAPIVIEKGAWNYREVPQPTTGKDVFKGPYNQYNLNPYDKS